MCANEGAPNIACERDRVRFDASDHKHDAQFKAIMSAIAESNAQEELANTLAALKRTSRRTRISAPPVIQMVILCSGIQCSHLQEPALEYHRYPIAKMGLKYGYAWRCKPVRL